MILDVQDYLTKLQALTHEKELRQTRNCSGYIKTTANICGAGANASPIRTNGPKIVHQIQRVVAISIDYSYMFSEYYLSCSIKQGKLSTKFMEIEIFWKMVKTK